YENEGWGAAISYREYRKACRVVLKEQRGMIGFGADKFGASIDGKQIELCKGGFLKNDPMILLIKNFRCQRMDVLLDKPVCEDIYTHQAQYKKSQRNRNRS